MLFFLQTFSPLYLYVFDPVGHRFPILRINPLGSIINGGTGTLRIFIEMLFFLQTFSPLYLYVFDPVGHRFPILRINPSGSIINGGGNRNIIIWFRKY